MNIFTHVFVIFQELLERKKRKILEAKLNLRLSIEKIEKANHLEHQKFTIYEIFF